MQNLPKELICLECGSESEIIVDRNAEVELIKHRGMLICHKPTFRSDRCYYHNKKLQGAFNADLKGYLQLLDRRRTRQ